MLSTADTGTSVDLEQWCVYVLQGVFVVLQKVDQLTRFDFLVSQILAPALKYARLSECHSWS
jgi:hypothetical protein